MTNEEYSNRHIVLYFLAGGVGFLLYFIAYRMTLSEYESHAIWFPITLGTILIIGWLVGVCCFSSWDEPEDNKKKKRIDYDD